MEEGDLVVARVQKWGNSLAVRIPKPFASEVGLEAHSQVEVTVQEGKLVIAPVPRLAYRLGDLLAGVRKSNLHSEVSMGAPDGDEAW
jgi:antitoxin MazE